LNGLNEFRPETIGTAGTFGTDRSLKSFERLERVEHACRLGGSLSTHGAFRILTRRSERLAEVDEYWKLE
jgi:hypothetical protein